MSSTNIATNLKDCSCLFCQGKISHLPEDVTWKKVLHTVLRVMMLREFKESYQMRSDILPFVERHWNYLWNKEKSKKWRQIVGMVLAKNVNVFRSLAGEKGGTGYWILKKFNPERDRERVLNIEKQKSRGEKRKLRSSPNYNNKEHENNEKLEKPEKIEKPIKKIKEIPVIDPLSELANIANDWKEAEDFQDGEDYCEKDDTSSDEEVTFMKEEIEKIVRDNEALEVDIRRLDTEYFYSIESL